VYFVNLLTCWLGWRKTRNLNLTIPTLKLYCNIIEEILVETNFKYDYIDSKWIDVDCIICTMNMTYNPINEGYILDQNDSKELTKFVTNQSP